MIQYYPKTVITAYINSVWTDISSVVVTDLEGESGIFNDYDNNRIASNGSLRFSVNDKSGTYSSTLVKGVKIKVTVYWNDLSRVVFSGVIDATTIDVGEWGDEQIDVVCLDWIHYAINNFTRNRPSQLNKTADQAITTLLTYIANLPDTVDLDTGDDTFTSIFDISAGKTSVYSELNDLIMSELGYLYLVDGGDTLRFENSSARTGLRDLDTPVSFVASYDYGYLLTQASDYLVTQAGDKLIVSEGINDDFEYTFDGDFSDLKVKNGDNLINEVSVTAYPRRVGTTGNLYTLDISEESTPVPIAALGTYTIQGSYSDPTGSSGLITGANVVTPVATTDYLFNSQSDGLGTDLTSNLSISITKGSDGFEAVITNTGALGYLTFFRVRGKPVYKQNKIEVLSKDTTSIQAYGKNSIFISQPYKQTQDTSLGKKILDDEKDARNKVIEAVFFGNTSTNVMASFLLCDVGDLVYIQNVKPSVDKYFYIQGIRFTITLGGLVYFSWILKETYSFYKGLRPLALNYSGEVDSYNVVNFGFAERVSNLTTKTVSIWLYIKDISTFGFAPLICKYEGTHAGYYVGIDGDGSGANSGKITWITGFDGGVTAQWRTTSDVLGALEGEWVNIIVTYDGSSTSNDPVIYVNGTSKAVSEIVTPVGSMEDDSVLKLLLGNLNHPSAQLVYKLNGLLKDVRIYDRILTSTEISTISGNENDFTNVSDGLIFQGVGVKTDKFDDYLNNPITSSMKVIDNVYGLRGDVSYNTSSTDYELKGADPISTVY